jgi:WhiB family redox-sensing transcriptional regulator
VITVFALSVTDAAPWLDDALDEGLPGTALVPACTDAPDRFFSEHPDELEQAKVLCRVCPIREACLEGALARREPWGVWGGHILERGRIVAYKRGPGRPRKQEFADAVA